MVSIGNTCVAYSSNAAIFWLRFCLEQLSENKLSCLMLGETDNGTKCSQFHLNLSFHKLPVKRCSENYLVLQPQIVRLYMFSCLLQYDLLPLPHGMRKTICRSIETERNSSSFCILSLSESLSACTLVFCQIMIWKFFFF